MTTTIEDIRKRKLSATEIRNRASDEGLYVLNTSDLSGRQARTEIVFTAVVDGQDRNIRIPATWVPIDLTAECSIDVFKNCAAFWDLYHKGYLLPIDTAVAEEQLDDEEARDEFARIFGFTDIREAEMQAAERRKIGMEDPKTGNSAVDQQIQNQIKNLAKGQNALKNNINPKVVSIINNRNVTEGQKLSGLKNSENEFSQDDFDYIVNHADRNETKLKEWANSKRKK